MRIRPFTFVSSTVRSSSSVLSSNEVAPEREPGGVDEDVDAAQLFDGSLDEALAARRVGDVELERPSPAAGSARRGARRRRRARLRAARARAVAAPMPLDAPVTTADFPSRLGTARA